MRVLAEKTGSILLTVWLCILVPVLFFYAPDRYHELGDHKFLIWRMLTVPFFFALAVCTMFYIIGCCRAKHSHKITPADIFLIVYTVFLTISFLLSGDRAESLWGTAGWRMGFLTELLMISFYLFARLFPLKMLPVICYAGISSLVLLVMAVLERLGIYLLPFQGVDDSFIATIGNMDWYCGCLALILSFAAGSSAFHFSRFRKIRSDHRPFHREGSEKDDLRIILCLVFSGVLLFLAILSAFSQRTIIGRSLPVILLLFAASAYSGKRPVSHLAARGAGIVLVLILTGVFFLPILFWDPGAFSSILPAGSAVLTDAFGNGRGGIWRISWEALRTYSAREVAFGIGPDMLAFWGYRAGSPIRAMLLSLFGAARLTNAHNETLTILLEEGLPAAMAWVSFLAASVITFRKKLREARDPIIFTSLIALLLLTIVQSVTFRTVTATPFLFVLLGAALRRCTKPSFM